MSGRIMPDPLQIAVAVTCEPPISKRPDTPLGCVSVVMMARAADSHASSRSARPACLIPSAIRSIGRNSPITPVEKGNTSFASHPRTSAARAQLERASARPRSPVAALALPLLTTRPRAAPRRSDATATGAARKLLWVNMPPTVEPFSRANTARSSRSRYLMPATAVPIRIPGTALSSPTGGKLTATVRPPCRGSACTSCRNRTDSVRCGPPCVPP